VQLITIVGVTVRTDAAEAYLQIVEVTIRIDAVGAYLQIEEVTTHIDAVEAAAQTVAAEVVVLLVAVVDGMAALPQIEIVVG